MNMRNVYPAVKLDWPNSIFFDPELLDEYPQLKSALALYQDDGFGQLVDAMEQEHEAQVVYNWGAGTH